MLKDAWSDGVLYGPPILRSKDLLTITKLGNTVKAGRKINRNLGREDKLHERIWLHRSKDDEELLGLSRFSGQVAKSTNS